jgi:hypothetical protein
VFPALVLVVCHVFTRGLEKPPYHLFFTIGAFFVFGLTARALMTGPGDRLTRGPRPATLSFNLPARPICKDPAPPTT